jgi:hypothetical protein
VNRDTGTAMANGVGSGELSGGIFFISLVFLGGLMLFPFLVFVALPNECHKADRANHPSETTQRIDYVPHKICR